MLLTLPAPVGAAVVVVVVVAVVGRAGEHLPPRLRWIVEGVRDRSEEDGGVHSRMVDDGIGKVRKG